MVHLRRLSAGRLGLVIASGSCLAAVVLCAALAGLADAASWRIIASPGGGQLNSISCTSRSACTAVGVQGNGLYGPGAVLAERWNGVAWLIQPVAPPAGGQSEWTDVSCGSPRFCVAVGSVVYSPTFTGSFRSIRGTWNGARWSVQVLPRRQIVGGVWCTSRRFCVMTGTPTKRWNGSRWSTMRTANHVPVSLGPISCTSAKSCVAISGGRSERWDGNAWGVMGRLPADVGPQGAYGFSAVSCASRRPCVAIGSQTAGGDAPYTPIVDRWNGARWTHQPGAVPQPYVDNIRALGCSVLAGCTMVGQIAPDGTGDAVPSSTLAVHRSGGKWTVQPTPNVGGDDSLAGISCVAGTCIAVGWAFTAGYEQTLIEQSA